MSLEARRRIEAYMLANVAPIKNAPSVLSSEIFPMDIGDERNNHGTGIIEHADFANEFCYLSETKRCSFRY